jgi:DNA-binding CsgD family transcriptional regulator
VEKDDGFDALLGDLYYGAPWSEPEQAKVFLLALGRLTRSCSVTYQRGEFARPAPESSLSVETTAHRECGAIDGRRWFHAGLQGMHEGAVHDCDGPEPKRLLASRHDDTGTPHPVGSTRSVAICVARTREYGAFLLVRRSPRLGGYDCDSLGLLRRVAPHLVNAYRLLMRFRHLEAQAAQPTLHHQGMFLLDANWRWVGSNEVADRMVANGWWRGKRSAPLDPVDAVTRAKWKALQQQIGLDGAPHRIVPVRDSDGELVALANVHAYSAMVDGALVKRFLLFVRPLQVRNDDAVAGELRQLFGLTAAESRLALALRKDVETSHAAAALGIAESSARTRLKSIFDKTSTHCRAELLVLLAALADTVV